MRYSQVAIQGMVVQSKVKLTHDKWQVFIQFYSLAVFRLSLRPYLMSNQGLLLIYFPTTGPRV